MNKFCGLIALLVVSIARAADPAPLELELRIPLGDVKGRIDHMAVDVARERLYVAELGNDAVGVVDLKAHSVLRTLTGFKEPQGIGYDSGTDTLYAANAGDGSVRILQGSDLATIGQLDLGSDADNIRVDTEAHRIYVGHADGAIAIIDATTRRQIGDIRLKGHPEGFQVDPDARTIWVNVPDAHEIAVLDSQAGRQAASWPLMQWGANFPMALNREQGRIAVVFRHPSRLVVFDRNGGKELGSADTCGDSDDVFVDARRRKLYVSCGEGYIDVFGYSDRGYSRVARIATVSGARTALYSPELDRLFLAVRASGKTAASVWVLKPTS